MAIAFISPAQTISPSATVTSGGYSSAGNVELSWTIGQTFNLTLSNGISLVQGVQQHIIPFYQDNDGDGYGNPNIFVNAFVSPTGYVSNSLDCNDAVFNSSPPTPTSSIVSVTICSNQLPYTLMGKTFSLSQLCIGCSAPPQQFSTLSDTLMRTNSFGCDSIVHLNLNIKSRSFGYIRDTICSTDSIVYNGHAYKQRGTYQFHYTNYIGCDSTVYLIINVKKPSYGYQTYTLCNGDSILYQGKYYKMRKTYQFHYTNQTGCDSIFYMTINTKKPSYSYVNRVLCTGDSTFYNGNYYKTRGTTKIHFMNYVGCDSTVYLTIKYLPQTFGYVNRNVCVGDSTFYNGKYYKTRGTAKIHLTNHFGCDSLVYLTVNINPQTYGYVNRAICPTDSTLYNGKYYKTRGTTKIHFMNHFGCDSLVYLIIAYNNSSSVKYDTFYSPSVYHWSNHNYTFGGHYVLHFTNYEGCDSSAYLNLFDMNGMNHREINTTKENHNLNNSATLNLYPNPTNNSFTIETNCINCGKMKIEMMNIEGQLVYETEMDNREGRMLITPNLSVGMYLVKVSSADKNYQLIKSVVVSK